MSLRSWTGAFAVLFGLVFCALYVFSHAFRSGSVDWAAAARRAEDQGEHELALRLRLKAVFYSGASAEELSKDKPDQRHYMKAMEDLSAGKLPDAEQHLIRAAESASPLIAARAKIRLEHVRYGAVLPNSERIPF